MAKAGTLLPLLPNTDPWRAPCQTALHGPRRRNRGKFHLIALPRGKSSGRLP